MPEALQKKYGPFKGWQWLLILIAGIGVGLLIRSRLGGKASPTTPAQAGPDNLPATQGAPTIVQEDSQTTVALTKEFDRFREELAERNKEGSGDERGGEIGIPRFNPIPIGIPDGPEDNSEPVRRKPAPKPERSEADRIRSAILNIFNEEQLSPPSANRMDRLIIEVQRGRTLQDIRAGLEAYKRNRPQLGIPV